MNTVILKKFVTTALLGLLFSSLLFASEVANTGAEVGKWTQDYDSAIKLAAEKKLPVLLNFTGSDWCMWCKLMDRNVFTKKEWEDYAHKNMVLVILDFPRNKAIVPEKFVDRNQKLLGQYGVEGFPTFIILDYDGKAILGTLGAGRDKNPANFIKDVEEIVQFSSARVEETLQNLPTAKVNSYKLTLANLKATKKAMQKWLNTEPARNAENEKKYQSFLDDISKSKMKLSQY